MIGYPIWAASLSSSNFNPALLNLTGWWQATNYIVTGSNGNWAPSISEGISSNYSLTNAFNTVTPPASGGLQLNGINAVHFIQSSNTELDSSSTGGSLSTFLGSGSWTISMLINITAATHDNSGSSIYQNDTIICSSAGDYFGVVARTSGIAVYIYNGGYIDSGAVAYNDATWLKVQAKYDGTSVYCRVNGSNWSSNTTPVISNLNGSLLLGLDSSSTYSFNGYIMDIATINSVLTDTQCDGFNSYYSSMYGI